MNKIFTGSLFFFLVAASDSPRRSPIDGIAWSGISKIDIVETFSLRQNTFLRADRIRIAAPIYTEGFSLTIQARELVFEGLGIIRGFEKPQQELKPQKPPRAQAARGLDCPVDDLRTDYFVTYKNLARQMSEQDYVKWSEFLSTLGVPAMVSSPSGTWPIQPTSRENFEGNPQIFERSLGKNIVEELVTKNKDLKKTLEISMFEISIKYLFHGMPIKNLEDLRTNGASLKKIVMVEPASSRINGRAGAAGEQGFQGYPGRKDPGTIEVAAELIRGPLSIDGTGQKGGKGGKGQNGQQGGIGGKGCNATSGFWDTGWGGDDNSPGGAGGRGGDGGPGGQGGEGGAPIPVKLYYEGAVTSLTDLTPDKDPEKSWLLISQMGEGGDPGESGEAGAGGQGGLAGDTANGIFTDNGRNYGEASGGSKGELWNPPAQEKANLRGPFDPSLSELLKSGLEPQVRRAKENIIDGLFKLQFERNLWTLYMRSLDFALSAQEDETGSKDLVESGRIKNVALADQGTLRALANIWSAYLTWMENQKLEAEQKSELYRDPPLDQFLKTSKEIGAIFASLQKYPNAPKISDELLEKIADTTAILDTRIFNLADNLSLLCSKYISFDLPAKLSPFRVEFCYDQTWRKDPEAVFQISKSLDLEAPASSAIKVAITKVEDNQVIPEKFTSLFKLSLLDPMTVSAEDSKNSAAFVVLGDESYRVLSQAVSGSHSFFENTFIRRDRMMSQFHSLKRGEINSLDQIRTMLVALGVQRLTLATEQARK